MKQSKGNQQIEIKKLIKEMEKCQDKKRFFHTLAVADTAANLAYRYEVDGRLAYLAGLLHDCAKCLSDSKLLNICKKNQLIVTSVEERNPYLLHGKAGAFLAETKYGVSSSVYEDVLNAIRSHTTGRPGMSMLEKLVFVADYIEPGRNKAKNLEKIRILAYQDIDLAVLQILEDTIQYLKNSKKETDSLSVETYEFYKKEKEHAGS